LLVCYFASAAVLRTTQDSQIPAIAFGWLLMIMLPMGIMDNTIIENGRNRTKKKSEVAPLFSYLIAL